MSLFITFKQSLISTICLHALFCAAQPDWSRCFEIRVGLFATGLEKKLETSSFEEVMENKIPENYVIYAGLEGARVTKVLLANI